MLTESPGKRNGNGGGRRRHGAAGQRTQCARGARLTAEGPTRNGAREKAGAAEPRVQGGGASNPGGRVGHEEGRGCRIAERLGLGRPGSGSAASAVRSTDRRCSNPGERNAEESASGAGSGER